MKADSAEWAAVVELCRAAIALVEDRSGELAGDAPGVVVSPDAWDRLVVASEHVRAVLHPVVVP